MINFPYLSLLVDEKVDKKLGKIPFVSIKKNEI